MPTTRTRKPKATPLPEATTDLNKALLPYDQPERFKLGEIGSVGLRMFDGVSNEELKKELNHPHAVRTYKNMLYHSAVNAAVQLYEHLLGKLEWQFVPPKEATERELQITQYFNEMQHDMKVTWREVIKDALNCNIYGYSVLEKVYRRRTTASGSKYNDGIIAWSALRLRAPESIEKFIFSEDGLEIIGVKQNLSYVNDTLGRYTNRANEIVIPRNKFLLFRAGNHKGNPYGSSPLNRAYLSWRYLSALEELEAQMMAKDLQGMPVLSVPMRVMAQQTPDDIRQYQTWQNILRNIQQNSQSGLMIPSDVDPETKQPLYKMELLNANGNRTFDTSKIKAYYAKAILTALYADILIIGQEGGGSYSLAEQKSSLAIAAAEALALEICEVINHDLVRQTCELNGWDVTRAPSLEYKSIESTDLETFSKAIQRMTSVNAIEKDREILNIIRESLGAKPLPADMEPQEDLMGSGASKAGEGFKTPFEGTRTSQGEGNDNDGNLDNAA